MAFIGVYGLGSRAFEYMAVSGNGLSLNFGRLVHQGTILLLIVVASRVASILVAAAFVVAVVVAIAALSNNFVPWCPGE